MITITTWILVPTLTNARGGAYIHQVPGTYLEEASCTAAGERWEQPWVRDYACLPSPRGTPAGESFPARGSTPSSG